MKTLTLTSPHTKHESAAVVQRRLGIKPVDGVYGPATAGAVKDWKWRIGYPTRHINQNVTASDFAYMNGTRKRSSRMVLRTKSRRRRFPERFRHVPVVTMNGAVYRDAVLDVGLTESPAGSNHVPKLSAQGVEAGVKGWIARMDWGAWCAYYVMLKALRKGSVTARAGLVDYQFNPLYCPEILALAQQGKFGMRVVSWADAKTGDFVMFNWDGGVVDHVGLLDHIIDSQTIATVEGNTSFDNRGSQSNGGAVASRIRYRPQVAAFIRYS